VKNYNSIRFSADDRGFNWEHILLLLPETIPFVALSATVGEPLDFLHWLQSFRSNVYYISTEIRRVPLRYYIYGSRLLPLNHHVFTQNEAAKLKTMETLRAALVTAAIVEALAKFNNEEIKEELSINESLDVL
jgi:superfamily II RNA helicase